MHILDLIETPSSISYYVFWSSKKDIFVQYLSTSFSCLGIVEISRDEYILKRREVMKIIKEGNISDYNE